MDIKVNYQNSILINNRVYIDPLKVDGTVKAEYIFITHPHWDHFSIEDITKIMTSTTKFICPENMKQEYYKNFNNSVLFVQPEKSYKIGDIEFDTFPSYNIEKSFHPKSNQWVGYNLNINGERVAIVGDSDNTPELRKIKTDILLLPIGGHYTMNLKEAANLTNTINPQKVIPTHYGEIVGDKNMGNQFKQLISNHIACELQI